jgi:hypothetical protein
MFYRENIFIYDKKNKNIPILDEEMVGEESVAED